MNDQFDRNLRSKIYPVETDVPDHVWKAVDQQLHPRKNRRWLFLIFLPVLLGAYWVLRQPVSVDGGDLSAANIPTTLLSTEITAGESESVTRSKDDAEQDYEAFPNASNASNASLPKVTEAINSPVKTREHPRFSNKSMIRQSILPGNELSFIGPNELNGDILTIENKPKIEEPSNNDIKKINLEGIPLLDFRPQTTLSDPKIDVCPSFSTTLQIRPFFELLISGGLPSKYFILRETELSNYQTLRERTEKERTSFTLQALVGADIGERFEVKAGLGATQIFEVFDYIDESATRTITSIITDTVIVDGIPRIRTDTSIVTQYGQRIKLSQNRYTTLELPIMATYKFKVQNHQFFIQGGAIINLALWTKGDILTSDEHITSIDTRESRSYPIFRSRTGLDITASLGYELELSESNKLRLLCSFRQTLGDFAASEYPLGQRYNHYHLGVSWKHQF